MMNNNQKQQGGKMTKLRRSSLFSFFTASRKPERACRSQTRTLSAIVILFTLTTAPAIAGNYELLKGKGVEVCEAYENALNAQAYRFPPSCQRTLQKDSLNPATMGFSKPEWESFAADPRGDRLLPQVWEYHFLRDVNPVVGNYVVTRWNEWEGKPEQYKMAHESFIAQQVYGVAYQYYSSRFDIDNDGIPDNVLLHRDCIHGGGHSLFVALTPDGLDLDREKTERLQAHPPFGATGREVFRPAIARHPTKDPATNISGDRTLDIKRGYAAVEDAWRFAAYDFFFYQGKTYYDLWWSQRADYHGLAGSYAGRLQVFDG